MSRTEVIEKIAKAICKSGKFETGSGCCAPICMENLGYAGTKCTRCVEVHGYLAGFIADSIFRCEHVWMPVAVRCGPDSVIDSSGTPQINPMRAVCQKCGAER